MASNEALIAHVLRRLTYGPQPGQVDELVVAGRTPTDVIEEELARPDLPVDPPYVGDVGAGEPPPSAYDNLPNWWTRRILEPECGLIDKMAWFWHGHLTSSLDKAGNPASLWQQHAEIIRPNALGNFREMVRAVTLNPAMLRYLDGNHSQGEDPNENYSRELMELFTLGVGNYSEPDVKAGARALAGWYVEDDGDLSFNDAAAYHGNVEFLGRTITCGSESTYLAVVDAACDHEACAPHIAAKLHRYLCGTNPSGSRRAQLAGIFRDSGLQIAPVVAEIVRDPSFLADEHRLNRPRFPVEWFAAAVNLFGVQPEWAVLHELGQAPFYPPNPAGWPISDKWLATGPATLRMAYAIDWATSGAASVQHPDPEDALAYAGVYEVTDSTRLALLEAVAPVPDDQTRALLLLTLIVNSPEYGLC